MKSTHGGTLSTTAANTTQADTPQNVDADDTKPELLHKDTVYHLLQNERRRLALRFLREVEPETDLGEMAVQVAAWENGVTTEAVTSDMRQRVYIALYQSHLPKLAEEGVLNYDKDRKHISRTAAAAQLDRYLTLDDRPEAPAETGSDQTAHVAVTAVGLLVLLASQVSAGFNPLTLAVTLALVAVIAVQQFGLPTLPVAN
ncbi:hypothetical protein ACFO0N_08235 [Halobium salinum]|uniref:DUF7344 domain-containing protein n=1 Tax=Halobium salinum TaxID=1364940 RepID=A0ABD5PAJ8_9EURY|nr:hypothetical protein [Halobium salinum]